MDLEARRVPLRSAALPTIFEGMIFLNEDKELSEVEEDDIEIPEEEEEEDDDGGNDADADVDEEEDGADDGAVSEEKENDDQPVDLERVVRRRTAAPVPYNAALPSFSPKVIADDLHVESVGGAQIVSEPSVAPSRRNRRSIY